MHDIPFSLKSRNDPSRYQNRQCCLEQVGEDMQHLAVGFASQDRLGSPLYHAKLLYRRLTSCCERRDSRGV